MRNEISKLHRNLGSTTIYVTHDQVEAITMADRIVIMKGGVVQHIGKPMDLYEHPVNKFVAGFIGSPQIVLFHSENMYDWNYVSVLTEDNTGRYGTMWECPDFFEIDGQYILVVSPQDMCADNEFHNGNNSLYFLGDYNKELHTFDYSEVYALDDGIDFYAPQTTLTPDGRRVMIGWMQSWDSNIRPNDQKWSCMMTVPRELKLKRRLTQSHWL